LIDAVQPNTNNAVLDARSGLPNGFVSKLGNVGSGWHGLMIDGIPKPNQLYSDIPVGQRTKIKVNSPTAFTDDLTIFALGSFVSHTKGILYSVKCYLNGQVVAEYDFTNPNNIVGDKVLQQAKNRIPSFDSGKWYLHPNFKVLGMDVGKLDATTPAQTSFFKLNTAPNANYLMTCITNSDRFVAVIYDSNNTVISSYGADTRNGGKNTITVPSNGVRMEVWVYSSATGSFDFIRPQLYELTGKEGTLFGNPVSELKAPKRVLYAKR
jgi:hypothetical protein